MQSTTGAPRRRPIPGPVSRYPGELALQIMQSRLAFFETLHRRFGDVARVTLGREALVLLSHPEAIRSVLGAPQGKFKKGMALERAKLMLGEGLLTSEGAHHLRQRRLVQPAFHRERIAGYADTMARLAEAHADGWRARAADAPLTIEASGEMHALALAIAGETFFGADFSADTARVSRAIDDSMEAFQLVVSPLFPVLRRIPVLPAMRRFRAAQAALDDVIARLVAARRAEGPGRDDLLGMLLEARDGEGDGGGMSERQLRDEVLTLLAAGHETTANLLTWTLCELAAAPLLQDALRAEVAAVAGDAPLGAAHVPRLVLARAIVSEALRLHPPAWIMGRRALVDHEIDGYVIPRGTTVLASQWIVHRDARWWPDPARFDPGRWLADAPATRPKFAFFPFGAGVRMCVGDQFAWTEAILAVAALVRAVRLSMPAGASMPVPAPSITLRAQRPVTLSVERV